MWLCLEDDKRMLGVEFGGMRESFMDVNVYLEECLNKLYDNGNYCVFVDLECQFGQFLCVIWYCDDGLIQDVIVWCLNDYFGMGQYEKVVGVMQDVLLKCGVGVGGM